MTQSNKEKMTRRKRGRIPEFKSREEEAKFWDAHSIADYMDEMKPVKVRVAKNLSEGLTIQFDPETITKLRLRAQKRGLGPTQLARMWIMEKLEETAKAG
jgi:hypothetical protein